MMIVRLVNLVRVVRLTIAWRTMKMGSVVRDVMLGRVERSVRLVKLGRIGRSVRLVRVGRPIIRLMNRLVEFVRVVRVGRGRRRGNISIEWYIHEPRERWVW